MKKASPGFRVPDVRRALRFYEEKLGFHCVFKVDDALHPEVPYAIVQRGDVTIHLSRDAAAGSSSKPFVHILVDDVDALYAEYVAAGVPIRRPPEDSDYGLRDFVAADEDGHELLVGQPTSQSTP